jgi:ubiquinone/menaquinone biosynthesis C-methylase UbiE
MRREDSTIKRLATVSARGGPWYAALFATRHAANAVVTWFDERLAGIEQRRGIVEPWAIIAKRLTAEHNRRLWNTYDWSTRGEEWTVGPEHKRRLASLYIEPHFTNGGTFIEIGPGGGKWTEFLQPRATKLYLVDVAETPLRLCRERFPEARNMEFLVSDGGTLPIEQSGFVDAIWSYDCFVHINPLDIRRYFREFTRVLAPGGVACIHHAGRPVKGLASRPGMRSDMTDEMAVGFAREAGLEVVAQTSEHVNPRDVITILRRPR